MPIDWIMFRGWARSNHSAGKHARPFNEQLNYDELAKKSFVSDIEHFGEKALDVFSVNKC